MADWLAYRGTEDPDDSSPPLDLPPPPPWRQFRGTPPDDEGDSITAPASAGYRALTFRASPEDVKMINAALYLRRPLLVTGKPGTGKSSLAHSVARELRLGEVLQWPITSRSTLRDGLYSYDAVARLQDTSLLHQRAPSEGRAETADLDVGQYVRLGPLGTALLPRRRPRVLVIDELDKSDIDLPSDLLNIFEEGEFEIPELARLRDRQPVVRPMTADAGRTTAVELGIVRCSAFPLVVITSNGEREFPPAFLRRCLRLQMAEPDADKLASIVEAHLGPDALKTCHELIETFLARRGHGELATDQLLNAVYLVHRGLEPSATQPELAELLLPYLGATPG